MGCAPGMIRVHLVHRKAMSTDAIALSELHNHRESLNNRDSLEWEQRDSDACVARIAIATLRS